MALLLQRFLLWQVLRDSHRLEVDLGSPEIARLVMNILNHKSGGHVLFQFSVWHESCRLISPRLNPKLPPRLTPPAIPAAGLSYPSWQAIYRTSLCAPSAYACANLYDYDYVYVCVSIYFFSFSMHTVQFTEGAQLTPKVWPERESRRIRWDQHGWMWFQATSISII